MPHPLARLGKRIASMRLATQIMDMLFLSLVVYGLWYGTLDGEPNRLVRAVVLTACMALVCVPMVIRGASMIFTKRWFIGVVCLVLGPMLCIGLFMLGAHVVRMLMVRV